MSTVTSEFSADFLHRTVPFFADIKKTAEILAAEVYLVGGSVRDMLTGRVLADVDIVPFKVTYETFAKHLAKIIKSPAVPFKDNMRLMKNGVVIDVSNPRGENIAKDLSLRDFTINNLACDMEGHIIGDRSDIDNKIIRIAHLKAFDDDPLRILRAFRFKSMLGFDIHTETRRLIEIKKPLAVTPALERIVEELKKTFAGDYFPSLFQDDLFISVIQTIAPACVLNQKNVVRLKNYPYKDEDIFPVFMALFFEGDKAEKFFQTLPLSSKEQKHISNLLRASKNIDFNALESPRERIKTAWRYYNIINDLILLLKCKYPEKTDLLEKLATDAASIDPAKADFIDGDYLKKAGLAPSPLFSTILCDVREKLILGDIDPRDIKKYIADKYDTAGNQ